MTDNIRIEQEVRKFPAEFGLRNIPGKFRIDRGTSYISGDEVMLYVWVERGGEWRAFAKGNVPELLAQVVEI